MEMHQIRYFLAVCSERNFTRAAKLCHISQPSLTRAIKLLEAEFGGLLFRREHPHSHLTELGEIVRPHLQQVWEQSYAAITQAHEFTAVGRSRLKIGIMCTIAPALLTDLLMRMRIRHKAIEVEIVDGSARDLEEQLVGGHILVARLFRQHRIDCEIAFDSPRDDWAQALIAGGLGFALMPQHSIDHPGVLSRPLIEPTLWREASLFTCRERTNGDGLDALVQEATRMTTASARVPAAGNSLADDAR